MAILKLAPAPEGEEEFFVFPDGHQVLGEVVGIHEKEMPFTDDNGDRIVRLNFAFRIVEGPHKGFKVDQDVYYEFHNGQRCRLYQWTQELFGATLQPGFELDTDDLVGKRAWLTLGVREWSKPSGENGKRNTVKYLKRESAGADTGQASQPGRVSVPDFGDESPF